MDLRQLQRRGGQFIGLCLSVSVKLLEMGLRGLTRGFFVGEGKKIALITCERVVNVCSSRPSFRQTKVPPSELSPPYFDKVQLIRIQPFLNTR